ncbi:MAG: response regulator [Elusimicrobia bacterium]|nr:response regulator [Elusimicrobiota bacterium]
MSNFDSILVVDDDASGRAMLGLSLRQAGYTVSCAASGPEALSLLNEKPFDWLLTDARMTPMDGFELSRRARRIKPDLRIMMMSAVCSEKDTAGYPIEKFFQKPIPMENLLQWIRPA